jgi:hypothetical protein
MGPNGSGKGARERCNLKELAGLDLAGAVLVQPREDVRELPRLLRRELPGVRAVHIPGGGCVAWSSRYTNGRDSEKRLQQQRGGLRSRHVLTRVDRERAGLQRSVNISRGHHGRPS